MNQSTADSFVDVSAVVEIQIQGNVHITIKTIG